MAASHNFQQTLTYNPLTTAASYIFPASFKASTAFICQRKKQHGEYYHPDFVWIPASAPLSGPGFWSGGVWWTTTSSTARMPIQIDVTNNGGSAGSFAWFMCAQSLLEEEECVTWWRARVSKRVLPESLSQAAFLAGLTWIHQRERQKERGEFLYVVNTSVYLSYFHSCLLYCCFVFSHEQLYSLHVQINTHKFHISKFDHSSLKHLLLL